MAVGFAADRRSLGRLVRAHRARLGVTQEELAERAGLSERTLRNLEGGRIRRPYPDTIRRLADALELTGPHRDQLEAAARGISLEAAPAGMVPSLLPPSVADFTGREAEVAAVLGLLAIDGLEGARAVVVSAVAGKPGIGKTTLAVHVAHRLRSQFPDGQLYVDLQGTQAHPLDPGEVLARFLRALGVDGSSIPGTLQERAERYRTLVADRRMLMVLDNAAGEAQVRPLVPGSPTCRVLVTSRPRLAGLEGALLLDLDVMSPQAAVALLARVAGPARVAAEPDAAAAIVGYCGRLPLAIRIAGARLAARRSLSLARLADRLTDERHRLDELAAGDLEVRASIALSYRALPDRQQRAFRRLGLLEAPDFAAWVAAALLDLPPERVEQLVDRLVDAQLLEVAGQDATGQLRYRFHDLLRAYARERAVAEEPAEQRQAALTRAFGAWLALAEEADDRFTGGSLAAGHGHATRWRGDPGLASELLADALAWFEAERPALTAAVAQAGRHGWSELAWDLASSQAGFLAMRNHFDDLRQTHECALAAATRAGNRRGRAYMLRGLGHLAMEQVRHDEATACIGRALPLFEAVGDRRGEAWAQFLLGSVERERDRHPAALSWLTQAVDGFRQVGDRRGEARALHATAAVRIAAGDHAGARPELKRSLAIFAEVGDHLGEAHVQSRFGVLQQTLGDLEGADAAYRAALATYEQYGDRASAAMNIRRLGELALLQGCPQESRSLLDQALTVLREVGDRYTEALTLYSLGELDRAEGHQAAAVDAFTQALQLCRTVGMPAWEARVQASLEGTRQAPGG